MADIEMSSTAFTGIAAFASPFSCLRKGSPGEQPPERLDELALEVG